MADTPRRRTGPRSASERLRRVLVMLPWLMERGEVPLAEMAARFRLTEEQLVRDLELVAMCGLPPFVDEMIDVFVDDGMVWAGVPRLFTRPLRLTAPEGFALVAAGRAALELPGADPDGALARALDKVAAVVGDPAVDVELDAPAVAEILRRAARAGTVLRLRYWALSTDELSERRIAARAVFTDRGHWYVVADDLDAGAERTFRLDRIDDLVETDETVPVREVEPSTVWFAVDDTTDEVTLDLTAAASWVAERYPVRSVEVHADGSSTVVLPVRSERWLTRLLLRLGPEATVVQPAEVRAAVAARARALLDRYATTPGDSSASS